MTKTQGVLIWFGLITMTAVGFAAIYNRLPARVPDYHPNVAKVIYTKSRYGLRNCPEVADGAWIDGHAYCKPSNDIQVYKLTAEDGAVCVVSKEEYDKAQEGRKWFCQ